MTEMLVMIPFWGVSEVVGHSREKILGKECDFCEIRPKRLDEPIKYTYQTIRELGIRPLMTPQEMIQLLQRPLPPSELGKMPGTRRAALDSAAPFRPKRFSQKDLA